MLASVPLLVWAYVRGVSDALVQVVDHDPSWPIRFAEEADRVSTVVARWLVGPVAHVGSTSVPGLVAKPVVDMLAAVESLKDAPAIVDALEAAGWVFWPDEVQIQRPE